MLPKSYILWKWAVYALATAGLFALQTLVLDQIHLWGVYPFLYPVLPAVLSGYEGARRGPGFSLCLGVVCDLLLAGPFEGFYAVAFTVIGLLAGLIGEDLLSPGPLCSTAVSAMALAIVGLGRMAVQALTGGGHLLLMGEIAVLEGLLTLPALLAVDPLYRTICRRCAAEY